MNQALFWSYNVTQPFYIRVGLQFDLQKYSLLVLHVVYKEYFGDIFLIKSKSFIVLHNIVATSYVSCVKFDLPTKYPILIRL